MKITINKPIEFDVKYIEVDAGVRYWEDSFIDGINDTDCEDTDASPAMPCAKFMGDRNQILRGSNYRWFPLIEVETGQILNWEEGITANISYKVCDDFNCNLLNEEKNIITSYSGYVPNIMCPSGDGFGDYIIMDIDEHGFIQKWDKEQILNLIKEEEN